MHHLQVESTREIVWCGNHLEMGREWEFDDSVNMDECEGKTAGGPCVPERWQLARGEKSLLLPKEHLFFLNVTDYKHHICQTLY
jgi:hypothetical protein